VLEAVKVWPGNDGAGRKVGAAANPDSFCARPHERGAVGTKKRLSNRTKKLTKEEMRRLVAR
jgi:hypothetical protein